MTKTTTNSPTPGPWVFKKLSDVDQIRRVIRGNGDTINVAAQSQWFDSSTPEAEADANWQLMASAQQQAEALKSILQRAEGLRNALALVCGSGAVPAKLRRPLEAVAGEVEEIRATAEKALG